MQTSQLLSSLLNRTTAASPQQIELTPGQVVKGTVLKLYPEQMATVQIGGMQVNAKLETNLEAGQRAWLQVQPSNGGAVTLKVLQDAASPQQPQDASLQGLLRSLGVADTVANGAIVRALLKQNLPVNKEVIQAFAQISRELGADEAAVNAFMLAMRRQLPLTKEVVSSLKAFLSGQTLTVAIEGFLSKAEQFLQREDADKPAGNRQAAQQENVLQQRGIPLKETLQALKQKLTGLPLPLDTVSSLETEQPARFPLSFSPSQEGTPAAKQSGGMNTAAAPSTNETTEVADLATARATDNTSLPDEPIHKAKHPSLPAALEPSDKSPAAVGKTIEPLPLPAASPNRTEQAAANRFIPDEQKAAGGDYQAQAVPKDSASGNTGQANKADLIKELFKRLGIAHERDLVAVKSDPQTQARLENVKAMLLQLTQAPSGSLPASLRDAAESLLQQVTGQQLMMVQPTNQTISQIVMQIPFRTPEGDETAYVQVEAKRREGGQLDLENCRLFFSLDLEQLGITMIDVAIVNRIVNLQIFNDQSWLEGVVQQLKEPFSSQLQKTGYHLSGMRVQPLPDTWVSSPARPSQESLFTTFKGMDIRV